MTITDFKSRRDLVLQLEKARKADGHDPVNIKLPERGVLEVYPASVRYFSRGGVFLAGNYNQRNALFILGEASLKVMERYHGQVIYEHSDFVVKKCRLTRSVVRQLRSDFPFCAPTAPGNGGISVAFGDVIGLAAKAQILAFTGKSDLTFSRQCIHQLTRMEFQPEDALDSITWAVFQTGYENGYAAEACQLTNPGNVEEVLDAGYTRLSLEPEDPCLFEYRDASKRELLEQMFEVDWIALRDKFELMFNRYIGRRLEMGVADPAEPDEQAEPLVIIPSEKEVLAAIRIFSDSILQMVEMEQVLTRRVNREDVILEASFSRSDVILTPFEHYFVMNELLRRDIHPDYFAPGKITPEHARVAHYLGGYGLSGPVDFDEEDSDNDMNVRQHRIYPDISYVTAMKCLAVDKPELFRQIWEKSRYRFEDARVENGSKLKIQKIPSTEQYSDDALQQLMESDYAEEFLTMTMGAVMTDRDRHGNRHLRQQLYDYLIGHEPAYTGALMKIYSAWARTWEENFSKKRIKKPDHRSG